MRCWLVNREEKAGVSSGAVEEVSAVCCVCMLGVGL